MPSLLAASANMRPNWPPPRMPIMLPAGSGEMSSAKGLLGICGKERDRCGLAGAIGIEPVGQVIVGQCQDRCGKQGGIDGAGFADGERADRNTTMHLHDG